jgi:DNA-binding NtrC family response regulator
VADLNLGRSPASEAAAGGSAQSLEEMELEEAERYLIRRALERHDGNVSHAASSLGLSRSALYRRLQRYGL